MRRITPILIVALAFTANAPASHQRTSLIELVGQADLVVYGTISEVKARTYLFDVEQTLVGQANSDRIEVRRFRDWTCASRATKYATGQQLVLFLTAQAAEPGPEKVWHIIGSGDEGEMLVHEGKLRPFVELIAGTKAQRNRFGPAVDSRWRETNPGNVLSAAHGWRSCFRYISTSEPRPIAVIVQLVSDEELVAFRRRSEVHDYLADETLRIMSDLKEQWRLSYRSGTRDLGAGRYAQAEASLGRAAKLAEVFGPDSQELVDSLSQYSALLRKTNRVNEADSIKARVRAIRVRLGIGAESNLRPPE